MKAFLLLLALSAAAGILLPPAGGTRTEKGSREQARGYLPG
jgi:hypothetical protein